MHCNKYVIDVLDKPPARQADIKHKLSKPNKVNKLFQLLLYDQICQLSHLSGGDFTANNMTY